MIPQFSKKVNEGYSKEAGENSENLRDEFDKELA